MRIIAFYLPQFHPIPENDLWWNPGFTEWTNVARARPLFKGHQQPRIPGELGFYDLRLHETREQQSSLAKEYGISGFCYYHYWFDGKLLLQRPIEEMLRTGKPEMDFCLCWANESWTANWIGQPDRVLMQQTYPGESDHRAHIKYLSKYFKDRRYIKIDKRPLFVIHRALNIPNVRDVLKLWRGLAKHYVNCELFLVGVGNQVEDILSAGYDAVVTYSLQSAVNDFLILRRRLFHFFMNKVFRKPRWIIPYKKIKKYMIRKEWGNPNVFPDVLPNWDNSPRFGKNALIIKDSHSKIFKEVMQQAVDAVKNRPLDKQIIFLKSWNEWAEGNYVEPDLIYGRAYLEVIRDVMKSYQKS